MILEFSFSHSSSSLVYEKIMLNTLKLFSIEGKLVKNGDELFLYVESEDSDELENFANKLSLELPHSIFLHEAGAKVVYDMPSESFTLPQTPKREMPFCPKCLNEVMNESDDNYYNIFTECDVCGYGLDSQSKSDKETFVNIAKSINDGLVAEVDTFYGKYYVGKLDQKCNDLDFDVVCYDLLTVQSYTNATNSEIVALGAIEKPLIRVKTNLLFKTDFEDIQNELIRFKLADDFVLHLLMSELHILGINLVFITKDKMPSKVKLDLVKSVKEFEPIEVVVSDKHIAILKGNKGLPYKELGEKVLIPHIGAFFSVIKEHSLLEKTVIGVNLSKDYHNDILIYSKKFGTIEYLSFKFGFGSIQEVFDAIAATDETGEKLVNNYKNKFSEHFKDISKIVFDEKDFNVYKLWGVVSIILGFSKDSDLVKSAQILENFAVTFMGDKGPRIDYKLNRIDSKVFIDPLMTVRTAMSFKLAELDQLSLSYGVIESFAEFISAQLDEIKAQMKSDSVVITGSLLQNRHFFSKLSKEVSVNHNLCFNKELPVDGRNIQYGGNELF
ncbi:hydrogenase [Candidatus Sulfurimonas marisnigri]|uniref:Hydrogenase n=1 Tax=Candidatus Sulfurimonas marisnigri TaxID=2740405 RepID=A0A7S7LYU3_9BACT|nr:hydrogenase [Candidatus Sulfurimonas marisnigri]QOY53980.1 hydrogenase [Candidatus Sulfurimonas marisnigri]